jgi:hypothetical protein
VGFAKVPPAPGPSALTPSPPATAEIAPPCRVSEATTITQTPLKKRTVSGPRLLTRIIATKIGTAPRSPTHPM